MINNLSVLSVIPARGGSKGIPLKNLSKVGGVPLVGLAANISTSVNEIDRTVVSTDNEEIALVANSYGADNFFRRPEKLSGDRVGDLEVLQHALLTTEEFDQTQYDIIVMLQPTSPLRKIQHVADCIKMLAENDYSAVWTLSETDSKSHPLKQLSIDTNTKSFEYYDQTGALIIARQQLSPVYHRNGLAYAIRRETLMEEASIKGNNPGALITPGNFISIDTELDLELTNFYLNKNLDK
ncbi:cytidylyltransferase domain-containing protein [Kiloniella sp. EL199]|uniref:acylneuraminate cytidylyltransferase family protein n=1 Tax=Kiloniella sp. EL199 TaxID=2107581 RepID=UPI000EA094F8|nr:acylneuraminate cytidylyltransferase family protein [Kiloniella sp. EL199]